MWLMLHEMSSVAHERNAHAEEMSSVAHAACSVSSNATVVAISIGNISPMNGCKSGNERKLCVAVYVVMVKGTLSFGHHELKKIVEISISIISLVSTKVNST